MIEWSSLLIFGEYTPLFFSIIALAYIMTVGGILKGLYAGLFSNLMIIMFTYGINTYFNYNLDLLSLVILEIVLATLWILSLSKT